MKDAITRRDALKKSLAWGLLGLGAGELLDLRAAKAGTTPQPLYDAVVQIFFEGGPSQTDTLDPKPSTPFSMISLGVTDPDCPGEQVRVTDALGGMAGLALADPSTYGLGLVRSVSHRNAEHQNAQMWMHAAQPNSVMTSKRPSVGCCIAQWRAQAVQARGVPPAVVLQGAEGLGANEPRGAHVPRAMQISPENAFGRENEGTFAASTTQQRADRRAAITDAVNQRALATRPDPTVRAWISSWRDALEVTRQGRAGPAFRYVEEPDLLVRTSADQGFVRRLSAAARLVEAGVPYVLCGLSGNDTHENNSQGVTAIWQQTVDPAVTAMARRLSAAGKRVLVVLGGEFGRTPLINSTGDGRDHWADGFSWGFLSINQPRFRTSSYGYTGPTGELTGGNLVNPVRPGVLGGVMYRALGIPVGEPSTDLVLSDGRGCPIDRADATTGAIDVMARFGLPAL
jgi:hypothetical protein